MPYFCRSVISQALNHGLQRSVSGSRILILGVAYKADIGDMRETPAEKLVELLRTAGAERRLPRPARARVRRDDARAPLEPEAYDCVAIVTAHSAIDYADVVRAREGRRRLPQRDAAATRSRARSGSSERPVRDRRRPGSAPGARTSSATSTCLADLALDLRRRPRSGATSSRAASRTRAPRLASTRCSPTPSSRRS